MANSNTFTIIGKINKENPNHFIVMYGGKKIPPNFEIFKIIFSPDKRIIILCYTNLDRYIANVNRYNFFTKYK